MTAISQAPQSSRWSMRRRLAVTAGLASALMLAATSSIVFLVVRGRMIADFDRAWLARGEAVTAALEYQHDGWDLDDRPETLAPFAAGSRDAAYQMWAGQSIVARSPSLAGKDLTPREATWTPQSDWMTMPDGRAGRFQTWLFTPDRDGDISQPPAVRIVVAAVADELRQAINTLTQVLAWATVIGFGASAGLMAMMTAAATRPLQHLSDQLASRAPGPSQPVTVTDPPRELLPVITHINQAFDRVETALAREKGFTADAAHELRTPLAALRLLLEVSLAEANPPDARRHDILESHALAIRLQRIVDALLALARLDRGLVVPRPETVDLRQLLEDVWSGMAPSAATRGSTINLSGCHQTLVSTDRELVRQVLWNLLDNAICHGDPNRAIAITTARVGSGPTLLTMVNDASTAPVDLSGAGQRLWRADQARTDVGRHVGIGLSLCQRIANVLQGDFSLTRRGNQVVVTLKIIDLPLPEHSDNSN